MGAMIVAGHSMCTDSTLNEIVRAQPPFGHFGRVIYVVNANDVGIAPPRKKTLYLSLIDCEIVAGDHHIKQTLLLAPSCGSRLLARHDLRYADGSADAGNFMPRPQ